MNEVKEELEASAVESAELTEESLGEVVGGNAPLADEPEGETLGSGLCPGDDTEHQRVIPKSKDKRAKAKRGKHHR